MQREHPPGGEHADEQVPGDGRRVLPPWRHQADKRFGRRTCGGTKRAQCDEAEYKLHWRGRSSGGDQPSGVLSSRQAGAQVKPSELNHLGVGRVAGAPVRIHHERGESERTGDEMTRLPAHRGKEDNDERAYRQASDNIGE